MIRRAMLAFVRHGQFAKPAGLPSAHSPHPLDDTGREQAREQAGLLARLVRERHWTLHPIIDTSSLLRAFETATIFAEVLGLEVESFDALAERSLGAAANLSVDDIAALVDRDPRYDKLPPGWKAMTDTRLPFIGAESLRDAGHRVAAHVEARAPAAGPVLKLFVGHGGSIRHGAAELGILTYDDVPGLSMYHCVPVIYDRTGRSWRHVTGDWKVRRPAEADDH